MQHSVEITEFFCHWDFLRETKFGETWVPKSAILTLLKALNFDFFKFLHYLKVEIRQIIKN